MKRETKEGGEQRKDLGSGGRFGRTMQAGGISS